MKKLILLAAPIAIAACSSGGADADGDGQITQEEARAEAANVRIDAGEWEVATEMTDISAPGMPDSVQQMMRQSLGQSTTYNHCITPEQAAHPEAEMFGGDDSQNCTYSQFDMSGGNMLIEATCQPEDLGGEMTMRMEGSYSSSQYDMTMHMTTTGTQMGDMTMTGHTVGHRVGECTADSGSENGPDSQTDDPPAG